MSHFTQLKTKMVEEHLIVRALEELGHAVRRDAEVRGWARRTVRAALVLERPGAAYDIGLVKTRDGYQFIGEASLLGHPATRGFIDQVLQRYAYHATREQLEAQGYELACEESRDGSIRMLLRRIVLAGPGPFAAETQEVESSVGATGEVALTVRGIGGGKCLEATRSLEEALGGDVIARDMTIEAIFGADPRRDAPNREAVVVGCRVRGPRVPRSRKGPYSDD